MTAGISFPAKGCLTSHSTSEINKMKPEEPEYKSWDDVARVTGMSVYFVKYNAVIYTVYQIMPTNDTLN